MSTYTQASRQIQVFTALAADVFLLQGFSGEEGISRPFQYDLYLHSEDPSISFDAVVGKKAAIRMILPDNSERYINGIVSGFSQAGATHREGGVTGDIFAHYHATVVPWTWMLTRTTDCRIFQNMSVPDIITKVFQDHGFSDFKKQLHGSYQPREYCVQYRETDLNFVSRLMEEEGIFYFFEHQPDKHILIMADSPGDFMTPPGGATVSYESIIGESPSQENVTEWLQSQEVRPGRYTINDFNFEKPLLDLTSSVDGEDERKFEIYDPPGRYLTKDEGERLVGIRMEEEDTPQLVISGSSNSKRFVAGYKFNLTGHYRRDFNRSYVLTTVRHSATQGTNYGSSRGGGAGWTEYSNEFQCIPDGTAFRPSRITPI
ncbi:MAG: type VI secretion system Vgr family protein, partial [Blastocatellia bacterium]